MALTTHCKFRYISAASASYLKKKKVLFYFTGFDREIVSEMGEMGVLGPTIKGEYKGEKKNILLFCTTEWIKSGHDFCDGLIACVYFFLLQVMAVRARVMWHMG